MIGLKVVRDAAETLPHIRQTKTPGREAALPQSPAQQRRGEDAFARRRAGNALQRCYISKSCSAFTVAFANYGHAATALRLTWSPPQFSPPDAFRTYAPHSDPFAAGRQKNANRCLRPSVPGSGRSRALPPLLPLPKEQSFLRQFLARKCRSPASKMLNGRTPFGSEVKAEIRHKGLDMRLRHAVSHFLCMRPHIFP